MANLSYKEAIAKGLVYPGDEQAALKLTGGGTGFASVEDYKKAFDTSYATKKSEVDTLRSEANKLTEIYNKANAARNVWYGAKNKQIWMMDAWRDALVPSGLVAPDNPWWGAGMQKTISAHDQLLDKINTLNEKTKSLSGTMETAMGKYKTATEAATEVTKRETGAMQAARRRLTRGTAGLLSKAQGAGGSVGTGLPALGEGTAGGLGQVAMLGQGVKL